MYHLNFIIHDIQFSLMAVTQISESSLTSFYKPMLHLR